MFKSLGRDYNENEQNNRQLGCRKLPTLSSQGKFSRTDFRYCPAANLDMTLNNFKDTRISSLCDPPI